MSCAYGRATPSTTFEVKMIDGELLTIGELAQRTGVARSALRYYEELDILRPNDSVGAAPIRRSRGRSRWGDPAAAGGGLLAQPDPPDHPSWVGIRLAAWRNLAASKVKDLDDRIKQAEAARSALQHALAHHHDDVLDCSRFWDAVTNRLQGVSLQASHPH
jgi:DNA-binding transcriptional MerR regulator